MRIEHEDKQKVCDLFCKTLKATRMWEGIDELRLDEKEELVTVIYLGSKLTTAYVEGESGWAILKDIMKALNRV